MYSSVIKPLLDYCVSLFAFVILLPVFLLTALILLCVLQGNPFFLQARPGLFGKIFYIIKFKTMTDDKDISGQPLPDSERLTVVGSFVRKLSLDELPQLLNVIKGEMSLIGPRPLLVEYLDLYSKTQSRRHEVKPGITGWAQVNGRNAITWQEKFIFDVWYVDNLSFKLDCKIILMTFQKVFRTQEVNQQGSVSSEKFTGE